jgi:hypothetical protein
VQSVESQNSFNSLRAVNFLKAKPSADRRMPSDEAEFWPNFGRRRFLRFELGGVVCRPNIVQVGSTQKGPKHKQCVLKLATVLVDLKAVDVGDGSPIEVDTKASPSGRVKTPKGIREGICGRRGVGSPARRSWCRHSKLRLAAAAASRTNASSQATC